jgi:hypothetical protein
MGMEVVGRLKSDVTLERANGDMQALARALADSYPEANKGTGVTLVPLKSDLVGPVKPLLHSRSRSSFDRNACNRVGASRKIRPSSIAEQPSHVSLPSSTYIRHRCRRYDQRKQQPYDTLVSLVTTRWSTASGIRSVR